MSPSPVEPLADSSQPTPQSEQGRRNHKTRDTDTPFLVPLSPLFPTLHIFIVLPKPSVHISVSHTQPVISRAEMCSLRRSALPSLAPVTPPGLLQPCLGTGAFMSPSPLHLANSCLSLVSEVSALGCLLQHPRSRPGTSPHSQHRHLGLLHCGCLLCNPLRDPLQVGSVSHRTLNTSDRMLPE